MLPIRTRSIQRRLLFLACIYWVALFLFRTILPHQLLEGKAYNVTTDDVLFKSPRESASIWKIVPGKDRILDQMKFKAVDVNNSLQRPKKILLLYHGWGNRVRKSVFQDEQCAEQNCEILYTANSGEEFAARVFKEGDLTQRVANNLIIERPTYPNEIWIFYSLESPKSTPGYHGLNDIINWTATYRHQSTIVTPYGKWVPFENASKTNTYVKKNYAHGKEKFSATFVSNCHASNGRLEYLNRLRKHIPIDVYGSCGDLRCAIRNNACFEMLRKDYKFYFAFENANCRDYVTEKFFATSFSNDVVPVVMGAHPDDYKRVAPLGSYIHIDDFPGPEELANYLLKVAGNDEEYNKYFRWKNTGSFINTKFWCRLCTMLWDPDKPRLSVPNLAQWWRGNSVCTDSWSLR